MADVAGARAITRRVKTLLSEQLGVPEEEITPRTRLVDDLFAEPSDLRALAVAFELDFDVHVSDAQAKKLDTMKAIVDFLAKHGGAPPPPRFQVRRGTRKLSLSKKAVPEPEWSEPKIPKVLRSKLADARVTIGPSGRLAAVPMYTGAQKWALKYVDDRGKLTDATPKLMKVSRAPYIAVLGMSISPNGSSIAVAVPSNGKGVYGTVLEIDATSGRVTELVRNASADGEIKGLHFVSDDALVVLAAGCLYRVARSPGGIWTVGEREALERATSLAAPASIRGESVVPVLMSGKKPLAVFGASHGLEMLGALAAPVKLKLAEWADGALFAQDVQGKWWRVGGLT